MNSIARAERRTLKKRLLIAAHEQLTLPRRLQRTLINTKIKKTRLLSENSLLKENQFLQGFPDDGK